MPVRTDHQDYSASLQTPQGRWSWTVRMDVSRGAPRFDIRDILSPYGILRDSIPLPGEIVQAMAQQVTDMASAFAPHIAVTPGSLTLTLDEGRGFGDSVALLVSNDGVYGSVLAPTFTTSAPWLVTDPALLEGLPAGTSGTVQVSATSLTLVAAASPYSATVAVQAPGATNGPLMVPVTVVVRPKAHIQLLPTSLLFLASRPLSGPFAVVPDQTFQIQNTGPSGAVLSYRVQKLTGCSPWLVSFTPSSGSLPSGQVQVITVRVQPPDGTLVGTYTEVIRVSGYSDNSYQDVNVTFTVM